MQMKLREGGGVEDAREPAAFGFADILAIVRRNLLVLVVVPMLAATLAGVFALTMEKGYTATVVLVLERNDPQLSVAGAEIESRALDISAITTEMDILSSRSFAADVVDALKLVGNPRFNPYAVKPAGAPPAERTRSGQASVPPPSPEEQKELAITKLMGMLRIVRVNPNSLAMELRLTSPDPVEAADLVNAIARLYIDGTLEKKRKATFDTIAFLRERAADLAAQTAQLERRAAGLSAQIGGQTGDVDLLRVRLIDMNSQLTRARADLAQSTAQQEQARRAATTGAGIDAVLTSPLLESLRSDLYRVQRSLDDLSRKAKNHPQISQQKSEIAGIEAVMRSEIARLTVDLDNQVGLMKVRVAQLETELATLQEQSRARELADIELRQLEREATSERARYDDILARLGALERQVQVLPASASVISPAEVPTEPSTASPVLLVAGGVFGGLSLAIFAVLVKEATDNRVRSGFAMERKLGIKHWGYVPNVPPAGRGAGGLFRAVRHKPRSFELESIRSVLWRCSLTGKRSGCHVIMVSSALPHEGKTSMSSALAEVSASIGKRTVLIDFDLRRHGATEMTRGSGRKAKARKADAPQSLQNYLNGEATLAEVARRDPHNPNLYIISTGMKTFESAAIFYSVHLPKLFRDIDELFDTAIVDTPPVLLVNEAMELSEYANAIVLVARWGRTKEAELGHAVELLGGRGDPRFGLVVNGVSPERLRHYEIPGFAVSLKKHAKDYYLT